jgi:Methyltransferase domain
MTDESNTQEAEVREVTQISESKEVENTEVPTQEVKEQEPPGDPNKSKYTINFNETDKRAYQNIGYILKTYGVPTNYVEVGVAEGSTITQLGAAIKDFQNGITKLYAIDSHEQVEYLEEDGMTVRSHFIHNLFICPNKNIEYMMKPSQVALKELIDKDLQPELIYIDGSHDPGDVSTDLILAWQLLKVGGMILVNDITTWAPFQEKLPDYSKTTPTTVVNNFIQNNRNKIKNIVLPDMRQIAFMKITG